MMRFLLFILLSLPAIAGRYFDGTQLGVCSIPAIQLPVTLFVWVAPLASANAAVLALNTTSNATERVQVSLLTASQVNVTSVDASGTAANATSGLSYSTDGSVFYNLAGVFTSATSRALYTNGVLAATSTTSNSADGFNEVVVGARKNTTYGAFVNGRVAECAVWDVALTESEILSLSRGVSPILVRPASLKFYTPLTHRETSTEVNYAGAAISLTNSPTASSFHPRIYK